MGADTPRRKARRMKPGIRIRDWERIYSPTLGVSLSIWMSLAMWEINLYDFLKPARIFWIPLTFGSSLVVFFYLSIEVHHALTNEGMSEDQKMFGDGKHRDPFMSYLRYFSSAGLVLALASLTYLTTHVVILGFSRFLFTSGYTIEDSLPTFSDFYFWIAILSALFTIWRVIIAITSKNRELVWKHVRAQLLKNGGMIIPALSAMFFYQFNSVDTINKNVLASIIYPLFSVAIYFLVDTLIALSVQTKIGNRAMGITFKKGFIYSCVLMVSLLLFYPIYILI